jgi:hypothetical protein
MDIRHEWLIVVQALLVKEYLSSMTGAIDRIVNGLFHRLMRSTPIPVFVSLFVVQSIRADDPIPYAFCAGVCHLRGSSFCLKHCSAAVRTEY